MEQDTIYVLFATYGSRKMFLTKHIVHNTMHQEVTTVGIIFKYMLRNLYEKKMRTFLILLAIALSTGVFFASLAVSDSMMKTFTTALKGYFGDCDIVIRQSEKSTSPFFYTAGAEKYGEKLEYIIGEQGAQAYYRPNSNEEVNLYLKGIELEDLNRMNPFSLTGESGLYPFEGRKLILSETTAEKYGIKLGDTISIEVGEGKFKFRVCGIAAPTGHFKGSNDQSNGVIPKDTLSSIANSKGKVDTIYIKLKNPEQKQEMIEVLSREYKNYSVEEPFPFEMLESQTREISMIFMMLSSVVFFMSLFIVYSSFKVITVERMPAIGTFRSLGATGRTANFMLIGESMLYGCIGGILGSGLGIGILYLMTYAMNQIASTDSGITFDAIVDFSAFQLCLSLFAAVMLCIFGSIVPILRILRIPVKDIVLNFMQKPGGRKSWRLPVGIVIICTAFALAFIDSEDFRPIAAGLGMVLSLIALIMLVPYITDVFVTAFQRLYLYVFGNIGVIAAKNLKNNRNILSSISMLAIGISSLLMINTAGYDSAVFINDMYKNTKYDIEVYSWKADRSFARLIRNVDGVGDVYGDYSYYHVELDGSTDYISEIMGIDGAKFLDFFNLDMEGDPLQAFQKLDEERSLLISESLQKTLKVKVGDYVNLKTQRGVKPYKVTGTFKKLMYNGQNCALASARFINADMKEKKYKTIFVKTNKNPEEVANNLKDEFSRLRPYIVTKEEMRNEHMRSNKQSMMLMSGFSILASVIGIFGILNNLMLSFIERKHSFAVYRSMGMSKRQLIRMVFIESVTGGLIGGAIGAMGGVMLITMIAGVSNTADISYPLGTFAGYVVAGAAIMLIASISPAIKTSKLNIIDEIKFE